MEYFQDEIPYLLVWTYYGTNYCASLGWLVALHLPLAGCGRRVLGGTWGMDHSSVPHTRACVSPSRSPVRIWLGKLGLFRQCLCL